MFLLVLLSPPQCPYVTLLMLAYPGAMFFSFIYSEAPFFLFSILFFSFLYRDRLGLASVAAFFLPLIRAVGVFAVLPFTWYVYQRFRQRDAGGKAFLWCLSPVLGWAVYFLVIYLFTGNPFEGYEAYRFYKAQPSSLLIFRPDQFLADTFTITSLHGYLGSALDRFWMLFVMVGLVLLWRKDKTLFLYAALMALIPAITARYASFTRYLAVVFPLAIVFGEFFSDPRRRYFKWLTVAFLIIVQVLLVVRHINFYWSG
jgi:hypothetical protein